MEDLSPKAKAAWEHVLRSAGDTVQTKEPEGYAELVGAGLLFRRPATGDYDRFEVTRQGVLAKDYDRLLKAVNDPRNFMSWHLVDAIRHILVRLGPPV